MEGRLISLLAWHAVVLTLQVKALIMPLELPNLQHLLLGLDQPGTSRWEDNPIVPFPAVTMLRSLRTLYVHCRRVLSSKGINLTDCAHLQYVGLQGAAFEGLPILPAGCALHVVSQSGDVQLLPDIAHLVSGLTARQILVVDGPSVAHLRYLDWCAPSLCGLKSCSSCQSLVSRTRSCI